MKAYTNRKQDQEVANSVNDPITTSSTAEFEDNRPSTTIQRQLQEDNRSSKALIPSSRSNNTGLPDRLKNGVEQLSGYAMDDVKVHYNSPKPAQLQAHAYAQGTDIHLAPGQEKHLPHEAWHVVQQKQGRVQPTLQMKSGVNVNDDVGLEREADVMGIKANSIRAKSIPLNLKKGENIENPIQRKIKGNQANVDLLFAKHKDRLLTRSRLEEQMNIAKYDVDKSAIYTEVKNEVNPELLEIYNKNIKFEHSYLYGWEEHDYDQKEKKRKIDNDGAFIDWDLEDVEKKVTGFWQQSKTAFKIRERLREGAEAYRQDSKANIPKLYAGTVAEGKEVIQNKTILAKLINDSKWFTDADGNTPFVKHAKSRSAVIGYSPQGQDIPLHIGHLNR